MDSRFRGNDVVGPEFLDFQQPPRASTQKIAKMPQRARPRLACRGFVVGWIAVSVKAMFGAGVDMNIHILPCPHAGLDRLHGRGRHMGIVSGEMHQDGAIQVAGFVQMLIDLHAVIAHRRLDLVPRARQIGELTTQAKTHDPDFAGASLQRAEGGNGIMLAKDANGNWGYPAFYTLASGSWGLQFGGQKSGMVFIIRSLGAVKALVKHQGKISADANVTTGHVGTGLEGSITTNLGADIIAYSDSKGLFGGISLGGSAMVRRNDFNAEYYGGQVGAEAILIQQAHQNPQADTLRQKLAE